MLTTEIALHAEQPFAGLAALSGNLLSEDRWAEAARRVGPSLHALLAHGRNDPLLPFEGAEALLVTGQPDEVPVICRDVISLFTRTGMASRALTALSFLREAVAIGQATPSLVRHVHTFLRELPKEQPRLFAPPPRGMGE